MKLSKEEVKKIGALSRIELSDEEIELFSQQLSSVLDYVDVLQEVDTDGVEETAQVTGLENVYRDDAVEKCDSETLIEQAPDHEDNMVKSKPVF